MPILIDCPRCNGTGLIEGDPCSFCYGSGKITSSHSTQVELIYNDIADIKSTLETHTTALTKIWNKIK